MSEPIEDAYFNWLYTKVAWREVYSPSIRYESLLYVLHCVEFAWIILGDDNRAEEGKELRKEFLREIHLDEDEDSWMVLGCSVLEMLIAFSRRAAFQTDKSSEEWFWIFMENLKLSEISDSAFDEEAEKIGPIIDNLVWRRYDRFGRGGGLFPLRRSENDQRKVEIWYQFCEYLVEQGIF